MIFNAKNRMVIVNDMNTGLVKSNTMFTIKSNIAGGIRRNNSRFIIGLYIVFKIFFPNKRIYTVMLNLQCGHIPCIENSKEEVYSIKS